VKHCTKCGELKSLSEFGKHRITKDGYAYQCKECGRKRQKIYSRTSKGVFTTIKGRNKYYKNKPFKMIEKDFIQWYNSQERKCVYCDIYENDLEKIKDCYNNKNTRLSVDCKNNDIGYEINNLVLACYRCNSIKSNILTFDEMMYVGQNFIKPKWEKQLRKANGGDNVT